MRNTLFGAALIVTLLVGALGLPQHASARTGNMLEMMDQMTGTLDAQSPEMTYTVELYAGRMFSLQAWPTSGDLQVDVVVSDPVGARIAQSEVLDQASGLSAAEGMIAEQNGTYSVTVRRVGETAGNFSLIVLPGYGSLEVWDQFDGTGELALTWCDCGEPNLYQMGIVDGQYLIEILEPNAIWSMRPQEYLYWEDHYVEASIQFGSTPPRAFGFYVRITEGDEGGLAGYFVYFNRSGEWGIRYAPSEGEMVEISPRQASPAIDVSDPNPRIGVLVEGYTFTVFFNGQVVGQATDTEQQLPIGELGLFAVSKDELPVQVYFDNLVITTPLAPASASEGDGPVSLTGILDETGVEENADVPFGIGQKMERDMMPAEERPLSFDAAGLFE